MAVGEAVIRESVRRAADFANFGFFKEGAIGSFAEVNTHDMMEKLGWLYFNFEWFGFYMSFFQAFRVWIY